MNGFTNIGLARRIISAVLLLSLLLSPWAISAQEENVSLNFVNADIEEVIKAVSHITGRNFVVDPRVKGTINIISSTPVAAPLAYDILLSTLRMQGFAAVEAGGVTKVLPEADAKLYVSRIDEKRGSGERITTRVFVLKYESAAQLVPVLRPLIAPNNIVVAYPNNNTLVVTDYASNLKRIEQIVNSIDQPSKGEPLVIPVKRASAVELAQTINRLLQDGAIAGAGATDSSQRFILLADARTNSLLVRTENQEKLDRVRDLVNKLDTETATLGNMHVVYLKNAEAVKLAQTLRGVLAGDTSSAATSSGAPSAGAPLPAGVATGPSGGGIIQADASTNSLIITAPSNIYNNIRAVIDMLDVRRAQVFVEALIAEVTADKAAEFGVQWQAVGSNGAGVQGGGGTNFGGSGTNIIGVGASIAASNPVVGTGLNIGVVRDNNLGILARSMQTDANANILSTPNLMMLDNEEAKIIIGQNVPFITGSQNGTAANPNPFQTIERKDVGLTLRIKPQISEGGTVKMLIFQEVSSVQDLSNPAGVITNKRSLDTTVLVDDGQILVLGGLIQDQVSKGEFKVPLLGDIPLLGWLFRYETRKSAKTNLMVFIRPTILRTAVASQGLTQDRYQYLRNQQEQSQIPWHLLLPSMPAPVSPELKPGAPASSVPSTGSSAPSTSSAAPVASSPALISTAATDDGVKQEKAVEVSTVKEVAVGSPVAEMTPAVVSTPVTP
jgi:general secretion pathway protein D